MNKLAIQFFRNILVGDEKTKALISQFEGSVTFDVKDNILVFNLMALHEILVLFSCVDGSEKGEAGLETYKIFQQAIYKSNINEQLQQFGGRIELHHSTGKVNKNTYRLIHI